MNFVSFSADLFPIKFGPDSHFLRWNSRCAVNWTFSRVHSEFLARCSIRGKSRYVFATEIFNIFEVAFVIMTYTWILTPATTILQYTALSKFRNDSVLSLNLLIHRNELSNSKRLLIAFAPTAFCLILIAVSFH